MDRCGSANGHGLDCPNPPSPELHECPARAELDLDEQTTCDCCESCTAICADSI